MTCEMLGCKLLLAAVLHKTWASAYPQKDACCLLVRCAGPHGSVPLPLFAGRTTGELPWSISSLNRIDQDFEPRAFAENESYSLLMSQQIFSCCASGDLFSIGLRIRTGTWEHPKRWSVPSWKIRSRQECRCSALQDTQKSGRIEGEGRHH